VNDFESMGVFNAGNDLLEESAGASLGHAAIRDYVVEKLATGVFEDEDDIGWSGNDFISVNFM
jgi:hypothetical protein